MHEEVANALLRGSSGLPRFSATPVVSHGLGTKTSGASSAVPPPGVEGIVVRPSGASPGLLALRRWTRGRVPGDGPVPSGGDGQTARPSRTEEQLASLRRKLFKRALITVSLEGASLRLTASRGRRILAGLHVPINPALVEEDLVVNPQGMAGVLRNAIRRLGYTPGAVLAAYPAVRGFTRIVSIPHASGVRPAAVLNREARRLMGVAVEQSYLYWHLLSQDATTEQYFLVAIPRPRLNSYVDTLILSGLRPRLVDLKPLALARSVGASNALVINLEHTALDVMAVLEGVPQVTTHTPMDETASLDDDELLQVLVEEVRRTLDTVQQRQAGGAPQNLEVFLTGGHFQVDGDAIPNALQESLNLTVRGCPALRFDYPEGLSPATFMVNLGLLLRKRR